MNEKYGWWFFTCKDQILLIPQSYHLPYGSLSELPISTDIGGEPVLFTSHQGESCWRWELPEATDIGLGEWYSLRDSMALLNAELFDLAGKAMQFALFLATHKFCGCCGASMQQIDWELAMQCESCGFRAYPRISPSIIMLVKRGREILLAQHRRHNKDGRRFFTTIAGFVEAGETLENAAHRELFEETAIKVNNLVYWKSQPWAFPHSLMAAFFADYSSGVIKHDPKELLDARWFDIDALPSLPPEGTIARAMINKAIMEIKQSEK